MRYWMRLGLLGAAISTGMLRGQVASSAEVASLREDVRLLNQRLGELQLTVEQLSRDNSALRSNAQENYVTLDQLNRTVADMNRALQSDLASQKRDILQTVASQMEKLGRQTNAALESVAKQQATRPVVQSSFSDSFPKEGINYTVQPGDSLSSIAAKNNARVQDIVNANKLADASKINVGQTLFIPQGK